MNNNLLSDVSRKDYFHVKDGRVLRNIEDLGEVLKDIEPKVFAKHVKGERNDIHSWVSEKVKNEQLAKGLLRAGENKGKALKVVEAWLNFAVKKNNLKLRKRKVLMKQTVVKKKLIKRRLNLSKDRKSIKASNVKAILRVLKDG